MASKAFSAALAKIGKSKNIETVLVGSSFLGDGEHDVTIQAVDTSKMDENHIDVTYIDGEGRTFLEKIFTMDQSQEEFSFGLRALWSALLPNKEALGALLEIAADDDKAFELFTGMKLRIVLKPGKGIQARATGLGKFAGFDVESGDKVTEEYDDIKSVYNETKGRALKRSYLRVMERRSTHEESNVAQFNAAVLQKMAAKHPNTSVIGSSFSPGV